METLTDTQGFSISQRQEIREHRLENYKRFGLRGVPGANLDSLNTEITPFIDKKVKLFSLREYIPSKDCTSTPTFEHYQLRHTMAYCRNHNLAFNATIKNERSSVTNRMNEHSGIALQNTITGQFSIFLDLVQQGKSHLKICSVSALDDLVVAGGVRGDIIIKRLYAEETIYKSLSNDENGISNFLKLYESNSGALLSLCCNNDLFLRLYDIERTECIQSFKLQWAPNCAALSNDKKMALVVGDTTDALIVNIETGKTISTLPGHLDHSFACDWAKNGQYFATGSQDETTRVYDVRNLAKALAVLPATMSAFRSLAFSPNSNYLLMAESADYVHVVDMGRISESMEIDFFSEISGICWNFKGDCFYIGAADARLGGVFEYERLE